MAHLHELRNTDAHFVIDPIARSIKNGSKKFTLIQYDHNSEIFTFEMPRYVEGHDMTACNQVEIHYINIETQTRKQNLGVYLIEDYAVSEEDENTIIWSWVISNNATQFVGSLAFAFRFACVAEDDVIEYAWSTSPFSDISVSNGLYNGEAVVQEYIDILAQWERKISVGIDDIEQSGTNTVTFILTDGTTKTITLPVADDSDSVDITDLGSMEGRTIPEFQAELTNWLETVISKASDAELSGGCECAEIDTVYCRLQEDE